MQGPTTGPQQQAPAANGTAKATTPAARPTAAPAKPVPKPPPPITITLKRAADIQPATHIKMLAMGFAKIGKSCAIISTSPPPVLVINSDDPDALEPVLEFDDTFFHVDAHNPEQMSMAINLAHKMAREGQIQTVVWDTISGFSPHCEDAAFARTLTQGNKEDGRKASPLYRKTMRSYVQRLKAVPCHLVIITHYLDVGGGDDDEQNGTEKIWTPKSSSGVVPMLYGAFRKELPGLMPDVVFMEKKPLPGGQEARVFVTGISGVYGPGCRSISGNKELPADVEAFIEMKRRRGLKSPAVKQPAKAPQPQVAATQSRPVARPPVRQ